MRQILLLTVLACALTYLGVGCVPPNLPDPPPDTKSDLKDPVTDTQLQEREEGQTEEAEAACPKAKEADEKPSTEEVEDKGDEEKAPAAEGSTAK